ncbi:MAG: ATP synthase subunit alpha [candidate division WS2 bacterium ADurb.Bin280]|uniref:ATP synthase subunit alpha n=1 Tax=candidate division WS2 bacterium ADurb.Bin280 TaxID=1852829 RepID=A0A1V5SBX7_9BACT|nr:MAG: ATP synthase subunit alpha [candidate division WS2 bacterium ADurb.Bin280]
MNELVKKLKEEIISYDLDIKSEKKGTIAEVADGIARILGLSEAKMGELLKIETKSGAIDAFVFSLEEGMIGAAILDNFETVAAGDEVSSTGEILKVPSGKEMIGRVVDALGKPIDGKGEIKVDKMMEVEKIAPGVITREKVTIPLQTGIKAIDALIPIGRGQRELIIGDRGTGKTAIAVDAIINQKNMSKEERPICIYVSIGQKKSKIARLVATLEEAGAMDYTIVVCATASDPAPLNYLAPYTGCAIGEYFMDQGRDVLVVYDDLTKQAWAYREIALLLRRPPGREAYPGDIFYLHSRLLERAAKLNKDFGGGSLTALPIIETQASDVSAYIPTNVISITDGQIFLENDLFYKGIRPALNIGISVSRVGGSAQKKAMKKVAGKLKLDLAQFRELEAFTQFGSDLDEKTKAQIERGRRLVELMKQGQYKPVELGEQVVAIFAGSNGILDKVPVEKIAQAEEMIIASVRQRAKNIIEKINTKGEFEEKDQEEIEKIAREAISSLEE